jgi:ligand-binding sensor domain-containing protein
MERETSGLETYSEGLAKFDGVNWTVYNTSNSGLPSNYIRALAIDEKGNIWIGTASQGLVKFDGKNWTVYKRSNSGLPDNNVTAIAIDGRGNKWIATGAGGLALSVRAESSSPKKKTNHKAKRTRKN